MANIATANDIQTDEKHVTVRICLSQNKVLFISILKAQQSTVLFSIFHSAVKPSQGGFPLERMPLLDSDELLWPC